MQKKTYTGVIALKLYNSSPHEITLPLELSG